MVFSQIVCFIKVVHLNLKWERVLLKGFWVVIVTGSFCNGGISVIVLASSHYILNSLQLPSCQLYLQRKLHKSPLLPFTAWFIIFVHILLRVSCHTTAFLPQPNASFFRRQRQLEQQKVQYNKMLWPPERSSAGMSNTSLSNSLWTKMNLFAGWNRCSNSLLGSDWKTHFKLVKMVSAYRLSFRNMQA